MSLRIITADERLERQSGVKALVVGPAGVGKTTLLKTLDPAKTLFFDLEAGDLAVKDLPVDQMAPRTWQECRELACLIGGPNPSLPDSEPYSQAHYDAMVEKHGAMDLSKYDTIFVDSLTVASRLCFTWAKQQPAAFNKKGDQDLLGAYGLNGREMIAFATQLQHARGKNVVLVAIEEMKTDDYGRKSYQIQMEGGKAGREIPGIVDLVLAYNFVTFDGKPVRTFVTDAFNEGGFPAKDRSGALDQYEEPHLGKVFAKIKTQTRPATNDSAPAASQSQNKEMETA
jgi:energy-coupling factor transporter ATP-binding protein EcfA2